MGSKYYYFTDPQLIGAQFAGQAFGPAPVSGVYDRFHITDLHSPKTAGDSLPAYALCDAQVCAQVATDSAGATTLSLILKPKIPPPFDFPFLCYVIYKGVDPASLLTSISGDIDASKADSGNKLVAAIQKRADEAGESTLSREWLGLHFEQAFNDPIENRSFFDTDPLDNLFYRCGAQHTLMQVRGGDLIGYFDASQFGLELLIERMGQRPRIALARRPDNYIKVATLAAGADSTASFLHWHEKEQALGYADPCAFWSSFRQHKLRVWDSATSKFTLRIGAAIYEDLLRGAHSDTSPGDGSYFNRSRAYVDVRNEHAYSLDYYRADGSNIQLTLDPVGDIDACVVDYYRSGWPCFWLGTSDLPTGTAGDWIAARFALPRTEVTRPLVFVSVGATEGTGKCKDSQRFLERLRRADQPFLEEAQLFIPLREEGGQTAVVASYQRLHLFKRPIVVDGVSRTPLDPNTLLPPYAPGGEFYFVAPHLLDLPAGASATQFKVYDDLFFLNVWTPYGEGVVARAAIGRDGVNVVLAMVPVACHATIATSARPTMLLNPASIVRLSEDALRHVTTSYGGSCIRAAINDPNNSNSPIDIAVSSLSVPSIMAVLESRWIDTFMPAFGTSVLTPLIVRVELAGTLSNLPDGNSFGALRVEFLESAPPVKRTAFQLSLNAYADDYLHC